MANEPTGGPDVATGQAAIDRRVMLPQGQMVMTFATLPATPKEGAEYDLTDATVNTWGASVTVGGGSNHVKVRYNGTAWTVIGK